MAKKQAEEPIKKYQSRYSQMLIEHMEKGYTYESFQAVAELNNATIKHWEENKRQFKAAKQLALSKSRMYWETIGILASQGNLTTTKKETVKKTTFYDKNGKVVTKDGKPEIHEEILERKKEMIPLKGDVWKFVMQSQFGWQAADDPAKIDPEGKAQAIKKFQLAYAVGDQPYVVKSKGETNEPNHVEGSNDILRDPADIGGIGDKQGEHHPGGEIPPHTENHPSNENQPT